MQTTPHKTSFHQFKQYDGLSALDVHAYNNKFAPHYHETYQVTWNRSGLFKNHIDNKVLKSWPGSIVISHPKEVHTTICEEPQGHSFFTLYLPPTLFKQGVENRSQRFNHVIHNEQALILMTHIYNAISQRALPAERLIFRLIKILQTQYAKNESKRPCMGKLTEHANKYYLEPFRLSQWASQLGLNKFKLLRSFKAETGMTPNQFVIYQRIRKSLIYLKQDCTVIEAALACGFYDAAHYYKNFKRIMGVTPLTFQQAQL